MNLFGKKKNKTSDTNVLSSINCLNETLISLEKREIHLQNQIDNALKKAKEKQKKKDNKGAIFELKRKKMFEKEIESIFGQKVNIETQILMLQRSNINQMVFKSIKVSKEQLSKNYNDDMINDISDVVDSINESIQISDEVSDLLSQPIGPIGLIDDYELEKELEELEELEKLGEPLTLPELPNNKRLKKQDQDQDQELQELKELENELLIN